MIPLPVCNRIWRADLSDADPNRYLLEHQTTQLDFCLLRAGAFRGDGMGNPAGFRPRMEKTAKGQPGLGGGPSHRQNPADRNRPATRRRHRSPEPAGSDYPDFTEID